jgi:hypothetical protein
VQSSTSKALQRSLPSDCPFWSRAIRKRFTRFLPASAYFEGPANESNKTFGGMTGRVFFEESACPATCDAALLEGLTQAGLAGVEWAWETRSVMRTMRDMMSQMKVVVGARLASPVEWGQTRDDFVKWAQAFRCGGCGVAGAAERQCASCGDLRCLGCAHRCMEDRTMPDYQGPYTGGPSLSSRTYLRTLKSQCAFALCHPCHEECSLEGEHVQRDEVFEMEVPGLCPNVCVLCPPSEMRCPAHVDCCILECYNCEDRRCMYHDVDDNPDARATDISPGVNNCFQCNFTVCGRAICQPGDRALRYCMADIDGGCGHIVCSLCSPSMKCPQCATRMLSNPSKHILRRYHGLQ